MSSLFGGKSGASASPQGQEERKQQVMNEVRQQLGQSSFLVLRFGVSPNSFTVVPDDTAGVEGDKKTGRTAELTPSSDCDRAALANAQELINKMNEKCFAKCITKPSTSLSSSDEGCLSRCTDRFLEAFNIISRTYVARVSKEREGALLEGGAQGQFGAGGGLI